MCKARLHTQGMLIVKRTNEHLHGPDIAAVSCLETKSGIKRKAHQTQDSTHHNLASVTQSAAIKLLKIDSLKRTIRQIINHAYPQPLTLADLVLPTEYQQTNKGDQFILYDSGQDDLNRFMIFGTHENVEMLKNSQIWLADGTFKSAPALFAQVYVIHSLRGRHLLPCLFVLLPNKTEAVYLKMWEKIQERHLIIDFEKAVINSFQHFWKSTNIKCCFFHLTQNIWRKLQAEGLQANYNNDEEFGLKIRCLPALAFVAPMDVKEYFEAAIEHLATISQALVLYFEHTYIGRTLPGGFHQEPMFPIEMWNQHQEVIQGIPRTNNSVEAWHRLQLVAITQISGVLLMHLNVNKGSFKLSKLNFLLEKQQLKDKETKPMKRDLKVLS